MGLVLLSLDSKVRAGLILDETFKEDEVLIQDDALPSEKLFGFVIFTETLSPVAEPSVSWEDPTEWDLINLKGFCKSSSALRFPAIKIKQV